MQKSLVLFKCLFFSGLFLNQAAEEELCRASARLFAAEGGPPPGGRGGCCHRGAGALLAPLPVLSKKS